MHCLALGGQGFLGSHIVEALLAAGVDVSILDRRTNKFKAPPPAAQLILSDWTNTVELEAALHDVDVVIHLISTTLPATSNQNVQADVTGNLIATLNLLDLCVKQKVRRVVFASSGGTVYGEPQVLPIPETHPTEPLNSHGIVKLATEKYLNLYHHLYGLEYVALRTANPYGELQDPDKPQGFVAVALGRILRQQPIIIFGQGEVRRDYVYVGDVAQAFVAAVCAPTAAQVYNVGSGSGLSLSDMLARIFAVTGRTTEVQYTAPRPADAPANVLDISRIQRDLGWSPRTDLQAGLERTWEWINTLPA